MTEKSAILLTAYLDVDFIASSAGALSGGCPVQMGVYTLAGEAVWIPENTPGTLSFPPVITDDPQLSKGISRVVDRHEAVVIENERGDVRFLAPVAIEEGCAGLVLGLSERGPLAERSRSESCAFVASYARLLGEALEGRKTAIDLTEELSERYEELSLMYALCDELRTSGSERKALESIFELIHSTLEADRVLLTVPGQAFEKISPSDPQNASAWRKVGGILQKRLLSDQEGFAINNFQSDLAFADLPAVCDHVHHVAAVSVDVDGDLGILAFFRGSPEGQIFMGDLKLLEAIARGTSIFITHRRVLRKQRELLDVSIFGLARLAESRDDVTGAHLDRVATYCRLLAEELRRSDAYPDEMDEDFVDHLCRSSPLHDIGKVGIPDAVMLKPGKLTPDEFEIMKTHSVIGGDTILDMEAKLGWGLESFLSVGRKIAYSHHEKWDGSGYPDGLEGAAIPLAARIMAVADVYDALTSKRCYKPAFSREKARDILVNDSGTHFDPDLIQAFLAVEELFNEERQLNNIEAPERAG